MSGFRVQGLGFGVQGEGGVDGGLSTQNLFDLRLLGA